MVLGYVLVHVLGLDVEEERVGVCVKELAPIAIPRLYLVIIEVVHEALREVEDAHTHVDGPVECQEALVDLDRREVVIKDVRPSEGRAGNEPP